MLLVAAGLTLSAAGCRDDDTLSEQEVEQLRASGEQRGAQLASQLQAEMAEVVSPEEVIGNVAAVTGAVNDGQIVLAELAMQRSDNTNVIILAENILLDHTALQQRQASLLDAMGAPPIDNAVSNTLRTEALVELEQLGAVDDQDFDLEFLRSQIELSAQDATVIRGAEPMVADEAFRAYLTDLAAVLETNLAESSRVGRTRL